MSLVIAVVVVAALIVIVKSCVASGGTPLVAVAVMLPETPAVVGVPLMVAPAKVRPAGKAAPERLKVGAGLPEAVKIWE